VGAADKLTKRKLLKSPILWYADRVHRIERTLVDGRTQRPLWVRGVVVFVVLFLANQLVSPALPKYALMLALSVMVGLVPLHCWQRAASYRSGWLDGRRAMVVAMGEASQRGMSLNDWLDAELERDMRILGIKPRPVED
jgi:hypothetical protein